MSDRKKLFYLSVLGYGDALISMQLLQQAFPNPADIQIIGSTVTRKVQQEILHSQFPLETVLEEHASFFRLKHEHPFRWFSDLRQLQKWVHKHLAANDALLFEKPDFRNRLILASSKATLIEPRITQSIYMDRGRMLERVTGNMPSLEPCRRPNNLPRTVLINPAARVQKKAVTADVLRKLYQLLASLDIEVSLIDPGNCFSGYEGVCDRYLGSTDLITAIAHLKSHDLYVGADSFFIHLAYYLRIPFITLLTDRNYDFYFAPPGSKQTGNHLYFTDQHSDHIWRDSINRFVQPEESRFGDYH